MILSLLNQFYAKSPTCLMDLLQRIPKNPIIYDALKHAYQTANDKTLLRQLSSLLCRNSCGYTINIKPTKYESLSRN